MLIEIIYKGKLMEIIHNTMLIQLIKLKQYSQIFSGSTLFSLFYLYESCKSSMSFSSTWRNFCLAVVVLFDCIFCCGLWLFWHTLFRCPLTPRPLHIALICIHDQLSWLFFPHLVHLLLAFNSAMVGAFICSARVIRPSSLWPWLSCLLDIVLTAKCAASCCRISLWKVLRVGSFSLRKSSRSLVPLHPVM